MTACARRHGYVAHRTRCRWCTRRDRNRTRRHRRFRHAMRDCERRWSPTDATLASFIALEAVLQCALIGYVYCETEGTKVAVAGAAFFAVASATLFACPLHAQRPLSLLLLLLAFALGRRAPPTPGLEWARAVLPVKYLASHPVRAEPYALEVNKHAHRIHETCNRSPYRRPSPRPSSSSRAPPSCAAPELRSRCSRGSTTATSPSIAAARACFAPRFDRRAQRRAGVGVAARIVGDHARPPPSAATAAAAAAVAAAARRARRRRWRRRRRRRRAGAGRRRRRSASRRTSGSTATEAVRVGMFSREPYQKPGRRVRRGREKGATRSPGRCALPGVTRNGVAGGVRRSGGAGGRPPQGPGGPSWRT